MENHNRASCLLVPVPFWKYSGLLWNTHTGNMGEIMYRFNGPFLSHHPSGLALSSKIM